MEKVQINEMIVKNKKKILIALLVLLGLAFIATNWEDFTAGLSGEPPVEEYEE